MDKTLYQDGLDVLATDLNNAFTTKETALKNRAKELCNNVGVTSGLVLEATAGIVTVTAGNAYDSTGERLELAENVQLVVDQDDVGRYVLLRALTTEGDKIAHPLSGVLTTVRTVVAGQVYLANAIESGAVVLGKIDTIGSGSVATFDLTSRAEWTVFIKASQIVDSKLDQAGSIMSHVLARGTGTVTDVNPHGIRPEDLGWTPDLTPQDHQARDHQEGVEQAGSTAGLVACGASVTVTQIAGSDSIVIDGIRLLADGIVGSPLSMADADTRPGLYEIWLSKPSGVGLTGTVGKTLRAVHVNPRELTGIQLVDVSPDHEDGAFTLTMSYSGGSRTIRWDDGPAVALDGTDRFYTVTGRSGYTVTVWIQNSALLTYGAVDVIEVFGTGTGRSKFHLASLFWFGLAVNRTGYGVEGTGGNTYDKRTFGTAAIDNLTDEARYEIGRFHRELRRDGWVSGGDLERVGAYRVAVKSGTVWIDGYRIDVPAGEFELPLNRVSVVLVQPDGDVSIVAEDPDGIHVSEPLRFARVGRVTTNQFEIIAMQDDRVILPVVDSVLRLGVGSRHNSVAQSMPRLIVPQGAFGSLTNARRGRTRLLYAQENPGFQPVSMYFTHYQATYTDPYTGVSGPRPVAGIEIAINCVWTPEYTPGVSKWVNTIGTADAVVYGFDTDGQYVKIKKADGGGANLQWFDTAVDGSPTWDDEPLRMDVRNARLTLKTADININNAFMSAVGYTNSLTPVNIVKAWAVLDVNKIGGVKLLNGFNVNNVLVNAGTTPQSVDLFLSVGTGNNFDNLDSATPRCSVMVSDDRGLHNPTADQGIKINAKVLNLTAGGTPVVRLSAADGSDLSITAAANITTQTVYVVVLGTQTALS
jgi:hypothetical protein